MLAEGEGKRSLPRRRTEPQPSLRGGEPTQAASVSATRRRAGILVHILIRARTDPVTYVNRYACLIDPESHAEGFAFVGDLEYPSEGPHGMRPTAFDGYFLME